jgi:hypothetical protein
MHIRFSRRRAIDSSEMRLLRNATLCVAVTNYYACHRRFDSPCKPRVWGAPAASNRDGFYFCRDLGGSARQGRMLADWSACGPNQETVFADFPPVSERSGPR